VHLNQCPAISLLLKERSKKHESDRNQNLNKSFGSNLVLKDINLSVEEKQVVCLIGSSGSGKSTLLRCINLLETPNGGEIIVEGQNIMTADFDINKYRSHVGMIFQSFNLFSHMNAIQTAWSDRPKC
jgi:putative lysine transport system ATP-binding protein